MLTFGKVKRSDGSELRSELTPMPANMRGLPVVRGYPVPWFVDWVDGVPEFRAMDPDALHDAMRARLCWVCGQRMGRYMSFVSGPMCGINRVSAEPPCHRECAVWSAINCPFLSRPDMDRREGNIQGGLAPIPAAGVMILRNPGVTMIWTTRSYDIMLVNQRGVQGGHLFHMDTPTSVEWFREGRAATLLDVVESIATGYPKLVEQCSNDDERRKLNEMRVQFEKFLPE